MTQGKKITEKIEASKKILQLVENRIKKLDSILVPAIDLLTPVAVDNDILLESNGTYLFYNPDIVIALYKEKKMMKLDRQYIHILLHGLVGHFYLRSKYSNKELVDQCMDTQVNAMYFLATKDNSGMPITSFKTLYKNTMESSIIFSSRKTYDNHELWNMKCEYDLLEDLPKEKKNTRKNWEKLFVHTENYDPPADSRLTSALQNMYGDSAGWECHTALADKKSSTDYKTLLKKFLQDHECPVEDLSSFDKMLYTWGFDNYENVALIEPEDITPQKKLRSLAIAIDTSGSCSGTLVNSFLSEIIALLHSLEDVYSFEKIYVMQCDTEIQYEKEYTDLSSLKRDFANGMQLYGFGGTSFVPVYDRCRQLCQNGEKLDCLLYFSDAQGCFPKDSNYPFSSLFLLPESYCNTFSGQSLIPDWISVSSFR